MAEVKVGGFIITAGGFAGFGLPVQALWDEMASNFNASKEAQDKGVTIAMEYANTGCTIGSGAAAADSLIAAGARVLLGGSCSAEFQGAALALDGQEAVALSPSSAASAIEGLSLKNYSKAIGYTERQALHPMGDELSDGIEDTTYSAFGIIVEDNAWPLAMVQGIEEKLAASSPVGFIEAVAQASLVDGETFTVKDGTLNQEFEFDVDGGGIGGAGIAVDVSGATTASDVATAMASAISGSALQVEANAYGSTVSIVLNTPSTPTWEETVADGGFTITQPAFKAATAKETVPAFTGPTQGQVDALNALRTAGVDALFLGAWGSGTNEDFLEAFEHVQRLNPGWTPQLFGGWGFLPWGTNGAYYSNSAGYIEAVAQANLVDAETFTLSDGTTTQEFEFDVAGDGIAGAGVAVDVSGDTTAADVAATMAAAINGAGLDLTARAYEGEVSITLNNTTTPTWTDTVTDAGFAITNPTAGFHGNTVSGMIVWDVEQITVSNSPVNNGLAGYSDYLDSLTPAVKDDMLAAWGSYYTATHIDVMLFVQELILENAPKDFSLNPDGQKDLQTAIKDAFESDRTFKGYSGEYRLGQKIYARLFDGRPVREATRYVGDGSGNWPAVAL